MSKTLIVIGGGAAGIFCAANAARLNPSLNVIVLEKSNKLLSKVLISGGGRCNCTHACFEISEIVKYYPRGSKFVRKTFHQFFTTDTVQWFEERGVKLKTEADGRMFPVTDRSSTIAECLLREISRYNVDVRMQAEVATIDIPENTANGCRFHIGLKDGRKLDADYLVVAAGGYPKSVMFSWILSTGHSIEMPVPSLFTFNTPANPLTQLMGVAVPAAQIKIAGTKFEQTGPVLITHWGLSGPAILKLSAMAARELADSAYKFAIRINWLPGEHEQSLADKFSNYRYELAGQKIHNRNPFGLPSRLWSYFLNHAGINEMKRWADLTVKEQHKLVALLVGNTIEVSGKTTFKEEFVTAGGIKLNEIDPQTMQSKIVNGLFFAGEIMDVDGVTGGFNFQHAWTSGFIAAKAVAGISDE